MLIPGMKRDNNRAIRLIAVLVALVTQSLNAQSGAPVIENVIAVADTENHQVTITYDLFDDDVDSLDVAVRISADAGATYLFPADSLSGDVGFPVAPGSGKEIIWHYTPDPDNGYTARLASFQAKIIADDRTEITIADIVSQVDSIRVLADLQEIEGVRHFEANPAHHEQTKEYLEAQFSSHGVVSRRHLFEYNPSYDGENIIGRHAGQTDEALTYIIDGHFDTVISTPGADDNGSGVTGMLEAMRVLSQYQFSRSIEFIGFDLEEVGIVGSNEYVLNGIPAYQQIEGVINYEMIGFTCFDACCDAFACIGDYITNASDVPSNSLRFAFDGAAQQFVPDLEVASIQASADDPNFRRSDHIRFWDAGIKALFLTDGANFRNPNYHQESDLTGTLDIDFLTNIVKTTVAMIAQLAEVRNLGYATSNSFSLNITGLADPPGQTPQTFELYQNYPNPFNPQTTINYDLSIAGMVSLIIYNISGRQVKQLAIGNRQTAGSYTAQWDGTDDDGNPVSSGMYLYRLTVQSEIQDPKSALEQTRKMILLR